MRTLPREWDVFGQLTSRLVFDDLAVFLCDIVEGHESVSHLAHNPTADVAVRIRLRWCPGEQHLHRCRSNAGAVRSRTRA